MSDRTAGRAPHLASRLQGLGTTVFSEMTALAVQHDAVNLGQGFPDENPPAEALEAVKAAMDAGHNQYAPGPGIPALRAAIAEHQHRVHGLDYDPDAEVTVTFGATEAVAASVLALCEVGDEVVVLEPTYDAYTAVIAMAGAVERRVALTPPRSPGDSAPDAARDAAPDAAHDAASDAASGSRDDRPPEPATADGGSPAGDGRAGELGAWHLDVDSLADAIGPRTRLLLLNSPHNPTGTVLDEAAMDAIARLCVEHELIAVTDEVYEHLVYDGRHVPLATRPGMRERTVTISSAGKTFSCTGWKTGWACAPPPLTAALRTTKQYLSFAGGTPLQHGVAAALEAGQRLTGSVGPTHRDRRDLLVDGLLELGIPTTRSAATYFVTGDVAAIGHHDADAFCRWAPAAVGVAAVPVSAFVRDPRAVRSLVRFAVCKDASVLRSGLDRLATATAPA